MEATLDYPTRLLLGWLLALVFGAILSLRLRWNQALGLALMSVPLWRIVLSFINNFQALNDSTTVLRAISPMGLSRWFSGSMLEDFGYLTLGFVAWQAHRNGWIPTPRQLANELKALGPEFQKPEARSLTSGILLFPLLLAATIVANYLVSHSSLETGDESSIFRYMTPYHTLFLSLAAGFGEELFYRGFLFVGMRKLMPGRTGFWVALVVQALIFGVAHSGYGTWSHVVLPTLFGLVAGLVAYRFGIWAAIAIHVMVDIIAFGAEASAGHPWFWALIVWGLLVNLLASIVAAGFQINHWYQNRKSMEA